MRRSAYLVLAGMLLTACGKKMDLMPVADPSGLGVSGLCRMEQERLVVTVVNRGKDHTLSSTTIVRFDDGPEKVLPTQPVAPGGQVEVTAVLPQKCLKQGCTFVITVDGRDDIQETDESNNSFSGACRPA